MESLDLTDDELRREHLRARKLQSLSQNHGYSQVVSNFDGLIRALAAEAKSRGLEL